MTAPRAVLRRPQYVRVLEAAPQPIRTLRQVAEIVGMSTGGVWAAEQTALAKIRKGLIEAGVVDESGKVLRGGGK